MTAFEIFVNGEFICRAALSESERNILIISLSVAPSGNNNAAKLQVMGSELGWLSLNEATQTRPSMEAYKQRLQAITSQGLLKWLQQKLEGDFKVEIQVVEAEPESITQPEIIKLELNDAMQKFIEQSYGTTFPPQQG
ncbi:MAG: hypothetical protein D6730_15100 [Bacteroidetes bacterium]|nr:MAG: hypothetical protein D6730_15100 [Bacteroidota bacterium]